MPAADMRREGLGSSPKGYDQKENLLKLQTQEKTM